MRSVEAASMGELKWYKRDPRAVLTGIAGLTLEERGAYLTVLELIYSNDGAVEDDDRLIAGWLRVHVRIWRRIRVRLLELGKLYVNGPNLRNERADREVSAALERIRSAAQAGIRSAEKRSADIKVLKNFQHR
jgi:uncharacterized protein YdaU (DUF1376 family)